MKGVCRIFDISMTWLLEFMQETFQTLPDNLNSDVVVENDDFEVFVLEADEMWSFVVIRKMINGYGLSCIPRQDRFWHFMLENAIRHLGKLY